MVIELLHIFAILCTAFVCGKLIAKIKLPAILGWLIAGIVFGPFLAGIVSLEITNSLWYNVFIKFFECFAGVMIGREIIFKKIASSGKQIIGITFVQFGGIALATAPAPALSIVNEYHTSGPVTKTLIPLAAIDDIIGVVVFFTVISIVNEIDGNASDSLFAVVGMISLPFVIGIRVGVLASFLIKRSRNNVQRLLLLVASLCTSAVCGLLVDNYVFHAFCTIAVALHNGTTVPDKKGEDRFFLRDCTEPYRAKKLPKRREGRTQIFSATRLNQVTWKGIQRKR